MEQNKKLKIFVTIASFLVFSISPLLIISQFRPYYHWAFERYQVYAEFPEHTVDELNASFDQVFAYLAPPFEGDLDASFYSERDILHMVDVQGIFIALYILWGIGMICIGAFILFHSSEVLKSILKVTVYAVPSLVYFAAGLATLFIFSILNWQGFFELFHKLVFPHNEYWLLDPTSSSLIKFLPGEIFQELAVIYLASLLVIYFILRRFNLILWKRLAT